MPSLHSLSPLPLILSLFFLTAHSQNPSPSPCTARLLPLLPCVPFVQGFSPSPSQQCCEGLGQLFSLQPQCLCLLMNDTSLVTSLPVNASLALRLPSLCSLRVDEDSCSGKPFSPSLPSNSTSAASPAAEMAPRPSALGLAFGKSAGIKLKANHGFKVLTFMAALCVVVV